MKPYLNTFTSLAACLFLAVSLTAQAQGETKTDPTGTWSWERTGRGGGQPMKTTLVLQANGDKLTGKLTSPGRRGGEPQTMDISEGTVKDGEIAFKISRTRGTNTFVMNYAGKVSGDSITGTIGFERGGETRTREWTAKRDTTTK
jgi:hypothetical protein